MAFNFKNHENIIDYKESNHLTLEILEGRENLAGAEFVPLWAFLDNFCKISNPDCPKWILFLFLNIPKIQKMVLQG